MKSNLKSNPIWTQNISWKWWYPVKKMWLKTVIFSLKVQSKCRKWRFIDPNFKHFRVVHTPRTPPRIASSLLQVGSRNFFFASFINHAQNFVSHCLNRLYRCAKFMCLLLYIKLIPWVVTFNLILQFRVLNNDFEIRSSLNLLKIWAKPKTA